MKRKPRGRVDPIEHEIERALSPGAFIGDHACFSFVRRLDVVAARIQTLIKIDPARATVLCETFLAGCHAKAEELDDSSGGFGDFVNDLICAWIKARQASGLDPDETATRLLGWMDDDPYGFCHGIEKDAVKVFDKAGLAAFEKQVRARFEDAAKAPRTPAPFRHQEVLRTLYLGQRNMAAYLALAEQTGITVQDCHALATLLVARRKPAEALAWVERGIDLGRKAPQRFTAAHYRLEKLQRELFTRLGRGNEALDAAWAEFREAPGKFAYDNLMKFVPKAERPSWHEKAMDAAKDADLDSLIELLLETKEVQRLADLLRAASDRALEQVSHHATEPAAKKLEKPHPDLAARLWRAQGMRIVNGKKSKYYDAALSNFERARRCYERAGLSAAWEETARLVSRFGILAAGSTNNPKR